jgi:methyltransferase (TIGR00027 family)
MDRKMTSRTAMSAATHRAAHQILEHGRIFSDPLAVAILGVDQDEILRNVRHQTPSSRRMRLFISIRTRFAEDALAEAYKNGVRQLVVLGAGLDTYAYRRTAQRFARVRGRSPGHSGVQTGATGGGRNPVAQRGHLCAG